MKKAVGVAKKNKSISGAVRDAIRIIAGAALRDPASVPAIRRELGPILRSSNAVKRTKVAEALRDPTYAQLPDREIGRQCGATHGLVAKMREEMDSLCDLDSAQPSEQSQVKGDTGQVVRYPPACDASVVEATEEDAALFDRVVERARAPTIRRVEIELHAQATETLTAPSDEELEAEAIRAEACGGL